MPKPRCGRPNSASIGQSGSTAPPPTRYRFHQPVRSETKCSLPSGDHSGWKTDSSGPPDTSSAAVGVPASSRPATHSSVPSRSEEHTSELQSRQYLVCRLLLEKKTKKHITRYS